MSLEQAIAEMREQCRQKEHELHAMRDELGQLERQLQRVCQHEFIATDNGDYHKPGYYYTCKKCQFWSMSRPKDYLVLPY